MFINFYNLKNYYKKSKRMDLINDIFNDKKKKKKKKKRK